jgi:hypothetical protein
MPQCAPTQYNNKGKKIREEKLKREKKKKIYAKSLPQHSVDAHQCGCCSFTQYIYTYIFIYIYIHSFYICTYVHI